MGIFDAIILGFVQGLTEFLPISSSGHLVLARTVLGIEMNGVLAFDAILHFATVLAVIVYFFPDIWILVQTLLRKLGRLPVNARDEILLLSLLVATIPAALIGFLAESYLDRLFSSPVIVSMILFMAAFFFIFAEWKYSTTPRQSDINIQKGFKIGLFQVLALMPGFSRSGATIGGGMILGLTRIESARFSFLLSIPIILGAGLKKMLDFITSPEAVNWVPVFVGSATACIVALIVIHFFLNFIRRYTVWPFIWYTLILSTFLLFVFWFG